MITRDNMSISLVVAPLKIGLHPLILLKMFEILIALQRGLEFSTIIINSSIALTTKGLHKLILRNSSLFNASICQLPITQKK